MSDFDTVEKRLKKIKIDTALFLVKKMLSEGVCTLSEVKSYLNKGN